MFLRAPVIYYSALSARRDGSWGPGLSTLCLRADEREAIEDTCPHRGGPLSEGILAEDEVICPWHGSRFNLKTGAVRTPPAQRNVKSFAVRIVGTDVEVEIE